MHADGETDSSRGAGAPRTGLGRRLLALLIDAALVLVVVQCAATVAFRRSDGYVQFVPTLVTVQTCRKVDSIPNGFDVPAGFGPDAVVACLHGFAGLPTAASATLVHREADGPRVRLSTVTRPVDAAWDAIRPTRLEPLVFPLFLVLRLVLDRLGGSPGRRLCAMRVAARPGRSGGTSAPALRPLLTRTLLFAAAFGPFFVLHLPAHEAPLDMLSRDQPSHRGFALGLNTGGDPLGPDWLSWASVLIAVVGAIAAATAVRRGRDAFYDRAAGTAVLPVAELGAAL